MKTGFRGTFVISWSQTEVDGVKAAPLEALARGGAWAWQGETVRVDGPGALLQLDQADGGEDLRRRAAHSVRRLVGAAMGQARDPAAVEFDEPLLDRSFVVTDGIRSYTITLIDTGAQTRPLLMFLDEIPPRGTDLWIVHHMLGDLDLQPAEDRRGGVICFTPGTNIRTPDGLRRIEDLREGDCIQTRDNGAQQVEWIGSRRMSGARLFVMPHLRPVRIGAGALGIERPDQELLVSPDHRMLVRGAAARALFNTDEVLVPARDLVNGKTVSIDLNLREVTYVHLLLANHQILWANGVETESFHPADADLSTLSAGDRARLLRLLPGADIDPYRYGDHARRSLSGSEAAILMHEAA